MEGHPYIRSNWVNRDTWKFISGLSFDGYFLAGNSVANMHAEIPLQGDLDFWVNGKYNFLKAFTEMSEYYSEINMYPSMLEMIDSQGNLPKINLIYTLKSINTLVYYDFDLPYCRCYWSPDEGKHIFKEADISIKRKIIRDENIDINNIRRKRILKAVNYKYCFSKFFWERHTDLLNSNEFETYEDDGEIYYVIDKEDLNMENFEVQDIDIHLTNIENVEETLEEIAIQYEKIASIKNARLPVLIRFNNNEKDTFLIKKYIRNIILKNPLSDSKYATIKIGTFDLPGKSSQKSKVASVSSCNPDDDCYNCEEEKPEKTLKKRVLKKIEIETDKVLSRKTHDDNRDHSEEEKPKKSKTLSKNIKKNTEKKKTSYNKNIDSEKPKKYDDDSDEEKCEEKPIKLSKKIVKKSSNNNVMASSNINMEKIKYVKNIVNYDMCHKIVQLNDSGTAYLIIDFLPKNMLEEAYEKFETMWDLHPENKHKIIMYEQEVEVNRYSKSYMNTLSDLSHVDHSSYMYSGFDTSSNNEELPECFSEYYDWIRSQDYKYNQAIVNWYENDGHISAHSDCQRGMIENPKIAIISLYKEPSYFKYIQFMSKDGLNVFNIQLTHGSVITMCGETQKLFVHKISKNDDFQRRISISFRQMSY